MDKFSTALILAGGKSIRMGFDKQTISINGKKIMQTTIASLKNIFKEIIITTNTFELYNDDTLLLIKDEIPEKGPLGGIYSALKRSSSEYIYVLACDMPNINIKYIKYMMGILESNNFDACVTKSGEWVEPFNAFYSINIIKRLEEHLKEERTSIYQFLRNINCFYIQEETARKFSSNWDMFANINTQMELQSNT